MGLSEEQHVYVHGLDASTFLDIVLFCGKPRLWWSPLLPPNLAYRSNIEGVNDIYLRKQSRKNLKTLGDLGKCCLWVFFSVFFLWKLGEVKWDICEQFLIRKTKQWQTKGEHLIWLQEPWCLKTLRLIAIKSAPCSNLQRFIQDHVVYWNTAVRKGKVGLLISSQFRTIFLISLPYLGGYLYYP